MTFRIASLQWKPATVSWVSFLLIAVLVTAVGLAASHHVIQYLGDQFILHGVDHNKEVTRRMLPLLRGPLAAGVPPQEVIARFEKVISQVETFGMSIFVIDVQTGKVIAHSEPAVAANRPAVETLVRSPVRPVDQKSAAGDPWQGAVEATSFSGAPALFYFTPVAADAASPAGHWVLAVQTDIANLLTSVHRFHGHMYALLLLTDGLIATLGFVVLRRVGRFYERSLESKVRERTEELQAVHAQMLHKTTLATIGQTAATLTHELRNPLASIKLGLSGLCSADYLQAREKRRVDIVLREVDRLDELLAETLDYVRPIKLSAEPVHVDRLVDSALSLVAPVLEKSRLTVQRTRCPECPPVRLDVNQIQQALLNLLRNAGEASPSAGVVQISLRRDGDALFLEIANGGPAMRPEIVTRVFEPFFTTKPKGTGLGLTLVKRVLDEHHGDVSIESGAAGTRVTLRLPLA